MVYLIHTLKTITMVTILCHYNEITLKGANRSFFEDALITMLRNRIKQEVPNILEKIRKPWGSILFDLKNTPSNKERVLLENIFQTTFGVANFSFTENCDQNIDVIQEKCLHILQKKDFSTFRIETRRSKKEFPLNSQEINIQIGSFIVEKLNKKVQLKDPETTCFIEIIDNRTLIYTQKMLGPGGLPYGTGGRALTLLSGGIDSPVASYLAFKKGLHLDMIHFHSLPYTSPASIQKVKKLTQLLTPYQSSINLFLIPLAEIQREITKQCPEKQRILLFRRCMMKISEKLAQKQKSQALITGESLGQVASQTIENMNVIQNAADMLILRPLLTFDKEEIMQLARKIGTFETSILPHEDCCTLFTPKHPETKARTDLIEKSESQLDIEKLIKDALEKIEKITIR